MMAAMLMMPKPPPWPLRALVRQPIQLGRRTSAILLILGAGLFLGPALRVPWNSTDTALGFSRTVQVDRWAWQSPSPGVPGASHQLDLARWLGRFLCSGLGATMFWLLARDIVRDQRIQRGRCACCGYDIRGAAEQCPECGVTIADSQTPVRITRSTPPGRERDDSSSG